jgi:hypothetical protein
MQHEIAEPRSKKIAEPEIPGGSAPRTSNAERKLAAISRVEILSEDKLLIGRTASYILNALRKGMQSP